ncbi:MAG: inositol monophosphatase [Candidatus Riflebacteria bacterium]|nr:inositol monophosphatase [Candidatus Riflebacteria bacterium]
MTWQKEADTAARLARQAGDLLKSRFATAMQIDHKGTTDLVTEMDLASERLIRDELARAFPGDLQFGEEAGGADFRRGRVWVFDPLDGTTNFAHGLPIFSVSIALCEDGRPRAGAVHQPMTGETFTARAGGGAFRNGEPIRVSAQTDLQQALVVTGFPYVPGPVIEEMMARLRRLILATQGVRRLGSAAMDLCYVAMGRFDAFWETSLKPWDVAAGALLVEEAGGRVTDFAGSPMPIDRGQILASNGHLHTAVQALLAL